LVVKNKRIEKVPNFIDIFSREELMEDVREREDENPLAYQNNKHKFI